MAKDFIGSPEVFVRNVKVDGHSIIDGRSTKKILKTFNFDQYKWDYSLVIGVDADKKHPVPWGGRDPRMKDILSTMRWRGYEPLRILLDLKNGKGKKYMNELLKIYKAAFMARRFKGYIRNKIVAKVAVPLKNEVVKDVWTGHWLMLDRHTISTRVSKANKHPEHATYEAGIRHPMIESGQFWKAITYSVNEVAHNDRMKAALGQDHGRLSKAISKGTKEGMHRAFIDSLKDSPDAINDRGWHIGSEIKASTDTNIAERKQPKFKSPFATKKKPTRGPSVSDIMHGRAGSGEVLTFDEDW